VDIMFSDGGKSIAQGEFKQVSLIIYFENTYRPFFACLGREESHCDAIGRIQEIQTPE
jgi:hypothetical protein